MKCLFKAKRFSDLRISTVLDAIKVYSGTGRLTVAIGTSGHTVVKIIVTGVRTALWWCSGRLLCSCCCGTWSWVRCWSSCWLSSARASIFWDLSIVTPINAWNWSWELWKIVCHFNGPTGHQLNSKCSNISIPEMRSHVMMFANAPLRRIKTDRTSS